jgi:hypothetical protein
MTNQRTLDIASECPYIIILEANVCYSPFGLLETTIRDRTARGRRLARCMANETVGMYMTLSPVLSYPITPNLPSSQAMSTGNPSPAHKLGKQRSDTLAYLNKEVSEAYQQASTTHQSKFIPRARNILGVLNLTRGECEELELSANKLKNAADEFNDLVGDLFDMVLANRKD